MVDSGSDFDPSMDTATTDDEVPAKGTKLTPFQVMLDDEDRQLLERVSTTEKLTRSDILRIALRRYAKDLGLENKPAA